MSSAQKKVIVRSFGDHLAWGYLPQDAPARDGRLELIDPAARVTPLAVIHVKWIAYVRDFNLDDRRSPERLDRRRFATRPRSEGLWVRLRFTDADSIEGLLEINRPFLDALADAGGLFLTPPDPRGNTQRLFIPRQAIQALEPLGLVLPPGAKPAAKPSPRPAEPQPTLFPSDPIR
jgi:hypothetical protein